jgi:hypothetical protein
VRRLRALPTMTFSRTLAKGQEWDAVYVLNVADGNFTWEFSTGRAELIDEERRLLCVAIYAGEEQSASHRSAARTKAFAWQALSRSGPSSKLSVKGGIGLCARLRVSGCLFHPAAPLRCRLGADERPSAHSHYCRGATTFRQVVEVCPTDAVSAAELRDREREHLLERKLVSVGSSASQQRFRRAAFGLSLPHP